MRQIGRWDAGMLKPYSGQGPEYVVTAGTNFPWDSWDFADGAEEFVLFKAVLPQDYVEGNPIRGIFEWVTDGSTTGSVVWGFHVTVVKDGETWDRSPDGSSDLVVSTRTAADQLLTAEADCDTFSGDTPSPGDTLMILVYRAGTNGSDNYTADASLVGFELRA